MSEIFEGLLLGCMPFMVFAVYYFIKDVKEFLFD